MSSVSRLRKFLEQNFCAKEVFVTCVVVMDVLKIKNFLIQQLLHHSPCYPFAYAMVNFNKGRNVNIV